MPVGYNQKTLKVVSTTLEALNFPNPHPSSFELQDIETKIFTSPLLVESTLDAPTYMQA